MDDFLAPLDQGGSVSLDLNIEESVYHIDYRELMSGLSITSAEVEAKKAYSQNLIGRGQFSFQFCVDLNVSLFSDTGNEYELKPGTIAVFFRPKGEHFYSTVNKGRSIIFTLHVEPHFFEHNDVGFTVDALPEELANIINSHEGRNTFYWCTVPMTLEVLQMHEKILSNQLDEPLQTPYYNAKCLELLCEAISTLRFEKNSAQRSRLIARDITVLKKSRSLIDTHYASSLSVSQLAKDVGMSERKFKQIFKLFYGIPPFEYMQRVRMEHGKLLLKEGRMNITEVAFSLGYEHACNFTTAFKRYNGVSPKNFQKSIS